MKNRAYSILRIKSVDEELRIIEGIATTPTPDRTNDVVMLDGIQFKLPMPFLSQHTSSKPIGHVIKAAIKDGEMHVTMKVAPAGVLEYVDEAWTQIKHRLVQGLSIGFKTIEEAYDKVRGGYNIYKSEWLELSAVTIPANMECNITSVKSFDIAPAASGNGRAVVRLGENRNLPGASGSPQRKSEMTTTEQITQFENKRAASAARLDAILAKSGDEGRNLDETEAQEHDTLESELAGIDAHLKRLRSSQARLAAAAVPVPVSVGTDPALASANRGGVITVKSNLPSGTLFARWVMAAVHFKGDMYRAAEQAKHLWPDTPEMELIFRAAVVAGTTTGTTWAAPLVPAAAQMQGEFIDMLRPATIIGKIPGLRHVPTNISVPVQTGGGTFGWVGEGLAKPVSAMAFTAATLRWAKAAGIVVMTKELIKFSNPSAEQVIRNSMIKDVAAFLDAQFVDPTVAEVTNVSPGSITNGAPTAAATGVTAAAFLTDLKTALATFIAANYDLSGLVILMSSTIALNVSTLKDSLGNVIYPQLTMKGGNILGIPVVVSAAVGARIIFVIADDIMINDEGSVEIDASEQASIVMDDAPQMSPVATSLVSLYQRNLVAIRVEKYTTWKRARTAAVYYISSASYSG